MALAAQDESAVEALAAVMAAEDGRRYDQAVLDRGARHAEPAVRRHAALAMGRIGDRGATRILLELLEDPDSTVQADAAFALGLLRDPTALPRLREIVLTTAPDEQGPTHFEIWTAIANTMTPEAGAVFREFLARRAADASSNEPPLALAHALAEVWRLGTAAPVNVLAPFTASPARGVRYGAYYSLARLRAPAGIALLLAAPDDPDDEIRAVAARALTREFAEAAGRDPGGVAATIRRLIDDPVPGVRIAALRALGTYADPALATAVADRVSDAEPNVRVEALRTLRGLGGPTAAAALAAQVGSGTFATRREALIGLAAVDPGAALQPAGTWITDERWFMRATGAEALGLVRGDTASAWLLGLLDDADGRVAARAVEALLEASPAAIDDRALTLLQHEDVGVRALAANRLAERPDRAQIDPLVDAYGRALVDPTSDARIAVIQALGAIAQNGLAERIAVEEALFRRFPDCDDYLVRQAAAREVPGAAARWGPPTPIATGRDVGDYRDLARRFVLGASAPGVVIETERGQIAIQLFAADAPLSVNAFLQLADQHFFDGGRWHRVVPDFVVQGGDPRGDGWGGPGFVLRDEVSRHEFTRGTVGIALAGPDTGGSQFFITLGPQPHLNGTYTVIGRVNSGMDQVDRVTQGDRIRTIRRR